MLSWFGIPSLSCVASPDAGREFPRIFKAPTRSKKHSRGRVVQAKVAMRCSGGFLAGVSFLRFVGIKVYFGSG
jgi:hypothetical protein